MRNYTISVLFILYCFMFKTGFSQSNKNKFLIESIDLKSIPQDELRVLDSSLSVYHQTSDDTVRLSILFSLTESISDVTIWSQYNEILLLECRKLSKIATDSMMWKKIKSFEVYAINNKGYIALMRGNPEQALKIYSQSKKILEQTNDKQGLAIYYNSVGYILTNQGNIIIGVDYLLKSLKLKEEIGDKIGQATSLNNIGYILKEQGDYEEALKMFEKSLMILKERNDKIGMAYALAHIASIYDQKKLPQTALAYYYQSNDLSRETKDEYGEAFSLYNISSVYYDLNRLDSSLKYLEKSIKIRERIQDKGGLSNSLNLLGSIYLNQNRTNEAEIVGKKSIKIAQELGYPDQISDAAYMLFKVYKNKNNDGKALEMFQLYISMRDSLKNEENQKFSIKQQAQYEYDKKAEAAKIRSIEEKKVIEAQLEKEKTQRYALFAGIILIIVFMLFISNRLRITRKQKEIIELQKIEVERQKADVEKAHHLLEDKNAEIIASIRYAKRIQDALLTPQKYIERNINRLKSSK
jgi:tetratricopeptide (TPR) repeat protein